VGDAVLTRLGFTRRVTLFTNYSVAHPAPNFFARKYVVTRGCAVMFSKSDITQYKVTLISVLPDSLIHVLTPITR
jgi:hypothetical protein